MNEYVQALIQPLFYFLLPVMRHKDVPLIQFSQPE